MHLQRPFIFVVSIFFHLSLLFASNHLDENHKPKLPEPTIRAPIIHFPGGNINQQDYSMFFTKTPIFIYEYSPPKKESDPKLGFSRTLWTTFGLWGSGISATFSNIQVTRQEFSISPLEEKFSLLTFTIIPPKGLNGSNSPAKVKIISHSGKKFQVILFDDKQKARQIQFPCGSTSNNQNTNDETLEITVDVLPGYEIVAFKGPKIQCTDELKPSGCIFSQIPFEGDQVGMVRLTYGEPVNKWNFHNMSEQSAIKENFLRHRWFFQGTSFKTQVSDEKGFLDTRKVFKFRDLRDEDLSKPKRFYSKNFSVMLGENRVFISDMNEENRSAKLTLYGLLLIFDPAEVIPFRVHVYRQNKLIKESECDSRFMLRLQAEDQIVIVGKICPVDQVPVILKLRDSNAFVTILEKYIPYIRISIQEQSLTLEPPRLYQVPLIPLSDRIQIDQITWISKDNINFPKSILFNGSAILFGKFFDQIDAGYITETQMKDYKSKYLYKPDCMIVVNNEKGLLHMVFTAASKPSFIVFRQTKDKDGTIRQESRTIEINEQGQEDIQFPLIDGDCYEIYKSNHPQAFEIFWDLYSRNFVTSKLNKMKDFSESLPLDNNIMGLMFTLKQAKKANRTTSSDTIRNAIITQRWFGGAWMENQMPRLTRENAENKETESNITGRGSPNKNPWELFWGYDKNEVWTVDYKDYILTINRNSLLIESKLKDDQSSMKVTLNGYSLGTLIQGIVPFTLAVYRGDTMAISWSNDSNCKFDDLEIGDRIVLIPWTFFLKNKPFSTKSVANCGVFASSLKSGNLVATIAEPKTKE